MNNAERPAMAIELNGFGQYAPESYLGLTKREHFAAMAMQGLLSNSNWVEDALTREGEGFYSALKYAAYSAADKMLDGE